MNTERPDNDDADGSAEEQVVSETKGAGGSAEEQDAAEKKAEAEEQASPEAQAEPPEEDEPEAQAEPPEQDEPEAQAEPLEQASPEAQAEPLEQDEPEAQDADAPDVGAPEDAEADDRDGARSGRRRSPAVVASVAAAVLLVGGGGAYLAATASGSSGGRTTSGASGDDTPPPLALDGYSASGGSNGIAPGEPNPYGVTYKAEAELPDGPGSAPVYRAQGEVTEDEVARLAKALGVDGTPVTEGQVWKIGAKDGSGPSLQVNQQAPGAWTFHRYSPGTDDCKSTTECASDPVAPADDPVSEAAAKKAAAPILKAVGQDDAKLDASQVMGAQRVVNADPVVGSLPTYGWTTGVTVNAQGEVVGGVGQLKVPVKGDTYPVLSAEKTLGLLNATPATDHRMGIGGCASPVPLKDRLEAPCGESTSSPSPATNTITVEKAVFGLAARGVDGRQALVPSWLFEVRSAGAQDGFTVTYPAVDPTYIATESPTTTPSDEPTGQPSPRPTGPDDPTSAPATRDVQVDGYSVEGQELTVSFTGGVCADYKAAASETSGEVTVTVTETPWPDKICIMIAKEYQQTVPLDEPLGDRKVVGSDGKEIPLKKAGARLPETSGAR
ncbi:hypothetical protein [Streptomyces fulvoviolaceus]|uniref:hypothetical protein n=1 Tax=Streptomyces fulvoviolaceus TaxID=285535 RepID=UPI0021C176F9|nr:hypothetical protein [Streptomyces fulvoviolaceus]MCT9077836.1 hypothetical protein [Streptomyces fulvoviolaceus]